MPPLDKESGREPTFRKNPRLLYASIRRSVAVARPGGSACSQSPALTSWSPPVIAPVHASGKPPIVPSDVDPDAQVSGHGPCLLLGGNDRAGPVSLHVDEEEVKRLPPTPLDDRLGIGTGTVDLKLRATGERSQAPLAEAAEAVARLLAEAP